MQAVLTTWLWTTLTAAGGGAVVTLAIVRAFGSRWLESMFEGRLQALRHQHERQLEDVRLEASRILDRSSRLTEREFEASSEAWSLVYEVYVQAASAMPGFRQYPDLSRASDEVVRAVLQGSSFSELETAELLSKAQSERNNYYSDRREAHQLWAGKKAVREASDYLAKKALFIEKDVHDRLIAFVDWAWKALVDWELIREMRGEGPLPEGMRRDDEDFRKGGEGAIKELEGFVRDRFWSRRAEVGLDRHS